MSMNILGQLLTNYKKIFMKKEKIIINILIIILFFIKIVLKLF